MTWLQGLTISLLTLLVGVNLWEVAYLWRVQVLLHSIQNSLNAWEQPQSLAEPLQSPGTSWAASDAEMAAQERRLTQESRQRARVGSPRSKRSLSKPMA